jgi:hypothetical protein
MKNYWSLDWAVPQQISIRIRVLSKQHLNNPFINWLHAGWLHSWAHTYGQKTCCFFAMRKLHRPVQYNTRVYSDCLSDWLSEIALIIIAYIHMCPKWTKFDQNFAWNVLLSYTSHFLIPQLNHVKNNTKKNKLLTLLYYFLLFIFPSCI